jgi:hypothetical protein
MKRLNFQVATLNNVTNSLSMIMRVLGLRGFDCFCAIVEACSHQKTIRKVIPIGKMNSTDRVCILQFIGDNVWE